MEEHAFKNNKEQVPFSFYLQQYPRLDPQEVRQRLGVKWEDNRFVLSMLGVRYGIDFPDYALSSEEKTAIALQKIPAQTLLLRYLLEGKGLPFTGQWKTFRQMPWGEVYVKPFTSRCINRAAAVFGEKIEAFCRACEQLGAQKVNHGDAAYELQFLETYRMQIIVWAGDEEFAPNAQILYSDNFALGFTAEDRVVAGDLFLSAITQKML